MKKIIVLLTALIFACSPAVFASHYQDSNSATATALAANGTNCAANQAAGGVDASGNAEACIAPDLIVGNEITNVSGSTLTRGGTGTSGDPYVVSLNVGNTNTWTAGQTFSYAAVTTFGVQAAGGTPNDPGIISLVSDDDDAFATTIRAGNNTQNNSFTLPVNDGDANQFLQTNGTGTLTWAAAIITEVDGIVGNEITNVSGSSLTRGGTGTGGDPYVVSLNVGNANAWTAQQDFQNTITAFGVDVAGGTTNTIGSLKFWSNGDNNYALTISPPTLATESWTLTLPTVHGSANQFLQTDGAGTTSWATAIITEVDPTVDSSSEIQTIIGAGVYVEDGTEVDPQVGTLTNTKWCTTDGSLINCQSNEPVLSESDPLIAGGRSTTRSTNDIDADAELYTDTKTIYIPSPTDADDLKTIWVAPVASTITKISCESDQTVVFDLQIDDGSPAAVNGSNITCTTFATDSTLSGDTSMAAGDRMDVAIDSVASAPTWVSITFEYTKDD